MELQQLNYFLSVARAENMSKAAQNLFVTQSALSKSIAQLESELGVNLFIRNGRHLELSGFGRVFYEYVESGLAQISSGRQELLKMSQIPHPVLSLHISLPEVFCTLVPMFLQQHPEIELRQRLISGKELTEALLTGKINLSISLQPENNRNLQWFPALEEELCLLVSKQSPLAGRQSVFLHELAAENFIDIADSETRTVCEALFAQLGLTYPLTIEVQNDQCLYAMVGNGCGIAFVPKLDYLQRYRQGLTEEVTVLRITSPRCVRIIGITLPCRRPLPEETQLFYEFALSEFQKAKQFLT